MIIITIRVATDFLDCSTPAAYVVPDDESGDGDSDY